MKIELNTDAAISASLQPFMISCTIRDVLNPYKNVPLAKNESFLKFI